ncbi:MAG: DUF4127 family protein [Acidobacteria bacterium]|nr:DUF4127 family protein [Acidobacteriota bacterium]
MSSRVLLIPLDDRPPCLQFPVRMGAIGDAEVVAPPQELLGRFTQFGRSDEIVNWLETQDLKRFDAAIVALDMLAYGGLVGSRVQGDTSATDALKRIEILRDLKKRAPRMPVYVQNVIMRLAPTGTGDNESYRARLAEWAEISVETDAKSKARTAKLEKEISAAALSDYKKARQRNLQINLKAVEMTRDGTIDYLILSQDDAKPKGIHIADREKLIAETKRLNLSEKIAVQPGADEVSMLLLSRAMNKRFNFSPRIKAVYSSEELANKAMPFEDRALRETVSYHIKATGSREVENERDADLLFYVYASRFENGRAESFADEIWQTAKTWKKYIVADIDPKGDVQGADQKFTQELIKRGMFFNYSPAGYASWNTAGNTIGTALPQGVLFALSKERLLKASIERGKQVQKKPYDASLIFGDGLSTPNKIASAQLWFIMHRLLDDYVYHSLVRPETKKFAAENKLNTLRFDAKDTRKVEAFIQERMQFYIAKSAPNRVSCSVPCCFGGDNLSVVCFDLEKFNIYLPWDRTFEAEINFNFRACPGIT